METVCEWGSDMNSRSVFGSVRCAGFGTILAILTVTGPGSGPAKAQEMPTVLLGTQPYPGEASIFVAVAKDLFTQAGVKVVDRKMPSGRLTMDAMLSGSLNIATPVETGPMFAIANGTELAILAQISTNQEEVKPAVRTDAGIRSAKDLKGKRLGYGAGSSNQFAMYNWLKAGGVAASHVTLVNLQPADLVSALVSGGIDVAFTWEPFLTAAVDKGMGKIAVVDGQNLYQSRLLLVARPTWANANIDGTAKLLRALTTASAWMKSNRAEAVKITADAIGMDVNALEPIFDRWSFEVELSEDLVKAFDAQFAWAAEAKLLPEGTKKPNYAASFFPDAAKTVNLKGVTYSSK
jgi:ABC-type nitrate/sulfonate/bicarbonate transport system substrate-binding protein